MSKLLPAGRVRSSLYLLSYKADGQRTAEVKIQKNVSIKR